MTLNLHFLLGVDSNLTGAEMQAVYERLMDSLNFPDSDKDLTMSAKAKIARQRLADCYESQKSGTFN